MKRNSLIRAHAAEGQHRAIRSKPFAKSYGAFHCYPLRGLLLQVAELRTAFGNGYMIFATKLQGPTAHPVLNAFGATS